MRSAERYFKRVHALTGTRYWINNPTRAQAAEAIREGAVGCTTNPTFISKLLTSPEDRDYVISMIEALVKEEKDDVRVLEIVQTKLVTEVAAQFFPIYEKTGHRAGYVSIQGDPLYETSENILRYAEENFPLSPNITPKIPVTPEGLVALRTLMERGVPVNATEVMSVRQFLDVAEAYEQATKSDPDRAVAFYSHIAGIFDEYLANYVRDNELDIEKDILYQAGISVAKKIYRILRERGFEIRFVSGGARGTQHFTEVVGAEGNVTINWHGASDVLLEENPVVIERFMMDTPVSVVDELLSKLPDYRKAYERDGLEPHEYEEFGPVRLFRDAFIKGWNMALGVVRERRGKIAPN